MRNYSFKKTIILAALFLFVFSIPANAASYKNAYRRIVTSMGGDYSLVYIDNDKIPELVITNGGGSFILIYTYKNGKTICLTRERGKNYLEMEEGGVDGSWKYGSGGFGVSAYYYIPKKNKLCHIRGHKKQIGPSEYEHTYVYSFFEIKKGRFEIMKSITYKEYQAPRNYKDLRGKYSKKKILKKLK